MSLPFSLSFVLSDWQTWAGPAVGLVSTGLTLYMGRLITRRSRPDEEVIPAALPALPSVDPFFYGSSMEERTAPRRTGNPVAVHVSDSQATAAVGEGWIVDRSVGGLAITLYRPVKVGTTLTVRPAKVPVGTPWTEVKVKSCSAQGSTFKLGCEFLITPTWNIMLLFG